MVEVRLVGVERPGPGITRLRAQGGRAGITKQLESLIRLGLALEAVWWGR